MSTFDQIVTAKAIALGKLSIQATTAAGSGHPSTALSLAHITTVLLYHTMRWDPANPHHGGSDRLVLSEGHAVPIIYAACADIGVTFYNHGKAKVMDVKDLLTLRDIHSPIDGHPNPMLGFPFFDAATGSLGQGLSVAAGLGSAARLDGVDKVIYCIIGDGESREGQIWEAMDYIADHKLTNVVTIFNANELGQSDWVAHGQSRDGLQHKAEAFGFKVLRVDGHNATALDNAFKAQKQAAAEGKPLCIVAETVKGWGAKHEQGMGKHGTPVAQADLPAIFAELDETAKVLGVPAVSEAETKNMLRIRPPLAAPVRKPAGKPMTFTQAIEKAKLGEAVNTKKKLSPRRAWGLALDALGESNPNVVAFDADVKNSTYAQDFAKHHPEHYFECRIAEQNMVSCGVGASAAGKIPFMSTFGKFFVRAFDQIEMGIISGANLKLVGTHIGVTLAADGPSQMAIADVAFLRAIGHAKDARGNPACTVLTPSDAVSTYNMVLEMADSPSAVYLRALRADTAILYKESDTFPFGSFKIVRKADNATLVIATNGYLVHTSLKAAATLAAAGINAIVVDAYSLPMDTAPLLALAEQNGGKILTVEDNYVGGLGSEVAEAAAEKAKIRVKSMVVRNIPKSGKTPEDVLAYVHLSEADIVAAAKGF